MASCRPDRQPPRPRPLNPRPVQRGGAVSTPRVIVCVENEADESLAHVLLAGQPVTVENGMTESAALSSAAYELGHWPHQPVALLFGTREARTPREIDAKRASFHRA